MSAEPLTTTTLPERSQALLVSVRRWAHEGERLALLAGELQVAADGAAREFALSIEASVDIARRALRIADDVSDCPTCSSSGDVLDDARELVALVDWFTERATADAKEFGDAG